MLEIKLIDDRSSPLTSLLAPPTKDQSSFTGVFEALIGAHADSESEIDPHSTKNTPTNNLETLAKPAAPDGRGCREAAGEGCKLNLFPGPSDHSFPSPQENDSDIRQLMSGTDGADIQNQRSAVEPPSPDGRGCREAAGEGYKLNFSPTDASESEGMSEQPTADNQVMPAAVDSADIQDKKSVTERPGEGLLLYPSPAASRHPLPLGEGLSHLSPHCSNEARAEKNSTPDHADATADDLTLLISNLGPITIAPAQIIKSANLIPETGAPVDATEKRVPERLNLAEFDVTRFEYKTETEPHLSPVSQSAQLIQMMRTSLPVREIKPVKPASSVDTVMQNLSSQSELSSRPVMLTRPDEVQHVRLVFEPPPPPPMVRSVSMDIGDPESQVRVVIRERNGNLNVLLGSTNEHLREDLQVAGPMLMRELQRNNPMPVTLDFSNFGTATDADSQSRSHSRPKKFLKPGAEFADVVETTYLPGPSSELKSL